MKFNFRFFLTPPLDSLPPVPCPPSKPGPPFLGTPYIHSSNQKMDPFFALYECNRTHVLMTQLDRTLAKSLHCQLGNLCSTTQRSKNRKNIAILASSLDLGNTTYYLINKVTRIIEFLLWILLVPGYMCNLGERGRATFLSFWKHCVFLFNSHILCQSRNQSIKVLSHIHSLFRKTTWKISLMIWLEIAWGFLKLGSR